MEANATLGAYRLIRLLGEGGMGAVWLAEHAMLGRRAAIKVLHDSFSSRAEIVTRFFNEARAATAIADPGIVQIFDFGHHSDGTAYIVMEMLDGESLEHRLRTRGTLGLGEVLRLMRQVASSLGAAHARGIVHRDLKPDNIFIVVDPEVAGGERTKLLDFGIAKLAGNDTGLKTQTSALMGTPMFMSPEQCRGAGGVDQRSDIYSLGCMMFLLLAGRAPFLAEGVGELIIQHVCNEPPALSAFVPEIPPAVEALVARCLAKEPAVRPENGKELAVLLEALMEYAPASSLRSLPMAVATPKTTLSSVASQIERAPAPPPRRRAAIVAALAVASVAAIVVVLAMRGGSDNNATTRLPAAPAPVPVAVPTSAPVTPSEPAPAPPVIEPPVVEPPVVEKAKPKPGKRIAAKPVAKPTVAAPVVTAPPVSPPPPDDFDERMKKQRERSKSGAVQPVD
ncbi:MAG: serine/threonine-protein kinase [Kofleriaceae bacterium]